ncbi:hypothetical protein MIH18_19240 [Marinobacter sp. M3C]|uniref:hypothetical protein n=1 Tax=unclassified Marinobacter TaxID=83889 RepID=UPI00200DA616|nr:MULTISPECIES: hypothetical protein [unclassified Marinobacter]MCL1477622.1 hypothetical protein [Marinobacter sp.]MCL1480944.1 hypothetical protein [Marinobacter sp.]MCL1483273.1 hypothetical protein [Marinobacter sp.]MCL1487134.1 hypothetical protein [Marinobacter sp.]UQG58255.1 hypothetical protein MIH16_15410 [Marinobacter sp. M4C]
MTAWIIVCKPLKRLPFYNPTGSLEKMMSNKSRISLIVPATPAAISDVWKLSQMATEFWSSAFSTINSRVLLWETKSPLDPTMMQENQRMVNEKRAASWEVGLEVQKAWLNMLSGGQTPWWTTGQRTLKPLHQRTTANAKRLSK